MKAFGQDYLTRWEAEQEEKQGDRYSLPDVHFKCDMQKQTVAREVRIRQAIVNELSQFLSNNWSDMLALKIIEIFSKYS